MRQKLLGLPDPGGPQQCAGLGGGPLQTPVRGEQQREGHTERGSALPLVARFPTRRSRAVSWPHSGKLALRSQREGLFGEPPGVFHLPLESEEGIKSDS